MSLIRIASLVGVALLVMVLNIVASILYMVVYGHLINPGHPKEFYDQHVQTAAPYCSIVAGIPLMFAAGYWVAGWPDGGVKAALVVWLAYAVIDVAIVVAVGMNLKIAVLVAVSMLTKLAAAWVGAWVTNR